MRQLEKEKQKKEHILVCLSSSPSNEKIIRTAAQMAQAFQAGFTALYVQTAEKTEKTPEDLARLQKHVRLAEQSGAEIVTTHSEDIALQIAEYARISEVTRIVIGKSMMKQGYFHQRRVWTERLTDLVPDLEIHIIPDSDVYRRYQKRKKFPEWMELPSWKELMLTVLILAAATGIGEIFFRLGFTDANIITVYLFGVIDVETDVVNDAVKEMAKNVAMQIAALKPQYTSDSEVSAEYIEHEKEILMAQIQNDPKESQKPAKVIEGMITGRIKKELKEICLLDQTYVKAEDGKQSVAKYVEQVAKENGAKITVKGFVRYETGDGIEKKEENFAEEVAKQMAQ